MIGGRSISKPLKSSRGSRLTVDPPGLVLVLVLDLVLVLVLMSLSLSPGSAPLRPLGLPGVGLQVSASPPVATRGTAAASPGLCVSGQRS